MLRERYEEEECEKEIFDTTFIIEKESIMLSLYNFPWLWKENTKVTIDQLSYWKLALPA